MTFFVMEQMIDVTFSSHAYSSYLAYYSIIAAFIVLVVALFGLIFLSMSNHTKSIVVKHWFEDLGLAFMVAASVFVIASFVVVPFFAKNEFYRDVVSVRSEIVSAEDNSASIVGE